MRILGRTIKHGKGYFKVIEPAVFVSWHEKHDPFWCRLVKGSYRGYEIGDEVTLPLSKIEKAINKKRGKK